MSLFVPLPTINTFTLFPDTAPALFNLGPLLGGNKSIAVGQPGTPPANSRALVEQQQHKRVVSDGEDGHHAKHPTGTTDGLLPLGHIEGDRDPQDQAIKIHHRRGLDGMVREAFDQVIDADGGGRDDSKSEQKAAKGQHHVVQMLLQGGSDQGESDGDAERREDQRVQSMFRSPGALVVSFGHVQGKPVPNIVAVHEAHAHSEPADKCDCDCQYLSNGGQRPDLHAATRPAENPYPPNSMGVSRKTANRAWNATAQPKMISWNIPKIRVTGSTARRTWAHPSESYQISLAHVWGRIK